MRQTFVVAEEGVEGRRAEETPPRQGRTGAAHRLGAARAARDRFEPGRSLPRGAGDRDELLFAVSGAATLELDGERHALEPDSGAYVKAGERYVIDNPGPEELLVVSTTVPAEPAVDGRRQVVVRFADRPELRADDKRTFRYLVNQDSGCRDATQFMGIVQPCRAPDHSHTYDELGYIVEGEGSPTSRATRSRSGPARPSTCRPSRCTASRTAGRE